MKPTLKFLNFTVNTQQQSLFSGEQRIEISSTAYQLLRCFLDQPNKTLSRQQLTSYVWPDRVVAETSLDKLIQRLRKVLGDTGQHKEIIKTIHGVGFVFLPQVQENESSDLTKKINYKWLVVSMAVLLTGMIAWLYWNLSSQGNESIVSTQMADQAAPQVLALIPDTSSLADQNQAWMLQGGMHYLKEQFKQSSQISIKNIGLKTLGNEDPERFAIELTINDQVDAALLVEITEVNNQFRGMAKLRDADGIMDEATFTSDSIKTLYDNVADWARNTLPFQSLVVADDVKSTMSQNRYAVENYIRGMSAITSGYAAEAIKYFDLATKEDAEFWLAWYELSLAYRKQGEYEKALSIINVFENVPLSDKNNLMIKNAKALNLYYLGDYVMGIETLNAGISVARASNNLKDLKVFLTNKSLFAKAMDDLELAHSSIKQSIAIAESMAGNQDASLGSAYNTLAGIEISLNLQQSAKHNALKAINYFKQAGNKRYEATAKSRLSSIHYALGNWSQGKNLIQEVLVIQEELNDPVGQSTSYMRLIDYAFLNGDFASAEAFLQKLGGLMDNVSNAYQNDSFLVTEIKVSKMKGDYQATIKQLAELKARKLSNSHLHTYFMLSLETFEDMNDISAWQQIAKQFIATAKFINLPHHYLTLAKMAVKKNNIPAATDAFEQAKIVAFEHQQTTTIADVMNAYIQFLLKHDAKAAQLNLAETEKYSLPPYPFLKIKAQVLAEQGLYFKALALLEELKLLCGDHWSVDDQLLIELYSQAIIKEAL